MLLMGEDGSRFELMVRGRGPSGWGYPPGPLDWLDTVGSVEAPLGRWTFSGESMGHFEAERLVDWLRAVAQHDDGKREIHFAEPDFSFEIIDAADDIITIRVFFELQGRPSWSPANVAFLKDIFVDLKLPRTALATAADSLRADLEKVS